MAQAEIDKEQITVDQDGAVGKAQFGTPRQILPGARLAGKETGLSFGITSGGYWP
jgi:hypothetical protein